jgi:uncharacterized protein YjbI with pentapeptide repeats
VIESKVLLLTGDVTDEEAAQMIEKISSQMTVIEIRNTHQLEKVDLSKVNSSGYITIANNQMLSFVDLSNLQIIEGHKGHALTLSDKIGELKIQNLSYTPEITIEGVDLIALNLSGLELMNVNDNYEFSFSDYWADTKIQTIDVSSYLGTSIGIGGLKYLSSVVFNPKNLPNEIYITDANLSTIDLDLLLLTRINLSGNKFSQEFVEQYIHSLATISPLPDGIYADFTNQTPPAIISGESLNEVNALNENGNDIRVDSVVE